MFILLRVKIFFIILKADDIINGNFSINEKAGSGKE